jgi:hypothetical protein
MQVGSGPPDVTGVRLDSGETLRLGPLLTPMGTFRS